MLEFKPDLSSCAGRVLLTIKPRFGLLYIVTLSVIICDVQLTVRELRVQFQF